jgi:hypothetical protein
MERVKLITCVFFISMTAFIVTGCQQPDDGSELIAKDKDKDKAAAEAYLANVSLLFTDNETAESVTKPISLDDAGPFTLPSGSTVNFWIKINTDDLLNAGGYFVQEGNNVYVPLRTFEDSTCDIIITCDHGFDNVVPEKKIATVTIPKFDDTVDLRTNSNGDLWEFDWTQTPVVATYSYYINASLYSGIRGTIVQHRSGNEFTLDFTEQSLSKQGASWSSATTTPATLSLRFIPSKNSLSNTPTILYIDTVAWCNQYGSYSGTLPLTHDETYWYIGYKTESTGIKGTIDSSTHLKFTEVSDTNWPAGVENATWTITSGINESSQHYVTFTKDSDTTKVYTFTYIEDSIANLVPSFSS